MADTIDTRRRAVRRGGEAEAFVASRLVAAGAEVLAMRWKARGGEVDLVVRRDTALRFVEVKARAGEDDGLASITAAKRRRIAAAASAWLDAFRPAVDDIGFLVALVDLSVEPWGVRWIDDAFDAP